MKNQKGGIKVGTIIIIAILMIIIIICYNIFKTNYFNGFVKAIVNAGNETEFSRDSKVKFSKNRSYKIENIEYNDSMFYKEIEVEPNTPYRISCMVKTENVQCELENVDGGVVIGLLDTTEYSSPITGTNDWKYVEYMFNSKDRDKVKISFRLGGNGNNCIGTAWFSDFKLEKGTKSTDANWNLGCFIINELNVNIEGKQYNFKINTQDYENVKLNLARFKDDCYNFTGKTMNINYEIIDVNEPATTISYSEEHGYYLSYMDVKDLIYETVKQKEYDHIFVVSRMENEEGTLTIPIKDNWIGLGSMDMYGIGYSLVRINKNSNTQTYKYGITNQAPEEVYIHEFCHTLERNNKEYGYATPALHDYEKYGYTEIAVDGLTEWYKDYMSKNILDESTGSYIGLNKEIYYSKPANSSNFKYPLEVDFNKEPQNIIEDIISAINVLTKK